MRSGSEGGKTESVVRMQLQSLRGNVVWVRTNVAELDGQMGASCSESLREVREADGPVRGGGVEASSLKITLSPILSL